ncbi:MAG: permease [Austwickia sp.]|nr:MAG: permease [Austwickia sp.]
MPMTHYMGLLSVFQPWNLLIFMAIPVILAETLAITELALLFGAAPPWVARLSRAAGLLVGPVLLGIGVHLLRYAVLPLTLSGGWRGAADIIAVLAYVAGAVPMIGITLVEVGLLGSDERTARRLHVIFVGVFLVVAHVAMIVGMLDPGVLGWQNGPAAPAQPMPGMHH